MRNRGIGRARMFMGALLLVAAVLTWGIGLMMSPHGETVAHGTEHVRTTIVTFKRNGAIGTLILSAVAAWLLFPRRRPKWPKRDLGLIVVLGFLGATSIYTLLWLRHLVPGTVGPEENFATSDMNVDANTGAGAPRRQAASMNEALEPAPFEQREVRATAPMKANDRASRAERGQSAEHNAEEQADTNEFVDVDRGAKEATNNETEVNQD